MVSNLGRNVAPDSWEEFGSSGSKAQDASWINPTAIDMTQYDTLLIEVEPGDTFTASEIEVSLEMASDSSSHIQWGSPGEQDMVVYVNEPLQQGLTDGKKQVWSFGDSRHTLLGIDALFVRITNKKASAMEMDGIKYRRVGFHMAG